MSKAKVGRLKNTPVKKEATQMVLPIGAVDQEIGKVYETRDYAKFSFFKLNRAISETNLKKLRPEIMKNGQLQTIIVDSEMRIADGQHRFTVLKELKMPIRYEINADITIQKIQKLQIGEKWKLTEHLHTYKHSENEKTSDSYKMYESFIKDFGLGHNVSVALLTAAENYGSGHAEVFKEGEMVISEENYIKARQLAKKVQDFARYHKGYKRRVFILAVLTLIKKVPHYNHDTMLAKMKTHSGELLEHGKTAHYVTNLISIYNKYTPKNKQISFDLNNIFKGA